MQARPLPLRMTLRPPQATMCLHDVAPVQWLGGPPAAALRSAVDHGGAKQSALPGRSPCRGILCLYYPAVRHTAVAVGAFLEHAPRT